ncbi:hypothetical protein PGTUg99_033493 [Puccinia graminis f. sp. tritici]|uniref:Uncharacterized protein n=1 Tax=Puccinia graminis f. sp. tritici TaxID=56615 RepID=A0A5B0Q954_PUCGR|nr:hypothetical protein PGTUg99_033493 [Puccinia graminis f. sp. tritici]
MGSHGLFTPPPALQQFTISGGPDSILLHRHSAINSRCFGGQTSLIPLHSDIHIFTFVLASGLLRYTKLEMPFLIKSTALIFLAALFGRIQAKELCSLAKPRLWCSTARMSKTGEWADCKLHPLDEGKCKSPGARRYGPFLACCHPAVTPGKGGSIGCAVVHKYC